MNIHEKYIARCLQLAQSGLPAAMPNPSVGAVLVVDDRIIGEGFTSAYGGPHAEVNAIASVIEGKLLKKATLYVSLEPCSHFGKTPPCSDLIIAKGIKKVVVGTIDPFAKVTGRGIQKLMGAGCEVTVGVLEKECRELNKRFFCFHQKKRPYIILKWAQTADGFIAPAFAERHKRGPVWITNNYSRQIVHKWRTEEAAVLVGTTTVIEDDPQLTARQWKGKNPVRIVFDRTGKIPAESAVFNACPPSGGQIAKTIVLTETLETDTENIRYFKVDFGENLPVQICQLLHSEGIQSLIVEGGTKTVQGFIDAGLWDEACIFIGEKSFKTGVKAPKIEGSLVCEKSILEDRLQIWRN